MPSKTLVEWPTEELLAEVREKLDDAWDGLARLGLDVVSGEPSDLAKETPVLTSETVAAVLEFVELTRMCVVAISEEFTKIKKWPAQLAWVRFEQENANRHNANRQAAA